MDKGGKYISYFIIFFFLLQYSVTVSTSQLNSEVLSVWWREFCYRQVQCIVKQYSKFVTWSKILYKEQFVNDPHMTKLLHTTNNLYYLFCEHMNSFSPRPMSVANMMYGYIAVVYSVAFTIYVQFQCTSVYFIAVQCDTLQYSPHNSLYL